MFYLFNFKNIQEKIFVLDYLNEIGKKKDCLNKIDSIIQTGEEPNSALL